MPDAHGWRGIILQVALVMQRTKRIKGAVVDAAWALQVETASAKGFDSLVYANRSEGRDINDSLVVSDPHQIIVLKRWCGASCEKCYGLAELMFWPVQ